MAMGLSLSHLLVPEGTAPAEGLQLRGTHDLRLSEDYAQELQGWVAPLAVNTAIPQHVRP